MITKYKEKKCQKPLRRSSLSHEEAMVDIKVVEEDMLDEEEAPLFAITAANKGI